MKDQPLASVMANLIIKTSPQYDFIAPDGTAGYQLANAPTGNMTSYRQFPKQISHAIKHNINNELWYILSGEGEIWIKHQEQEIISKLEAGVSIFIPEHAEFQFRNTSDTIDLQFICVAMPPWAGPHIVEYVKGPWQPSTPKPF